MGGGGGRGEPLLARGVAPHACFHRIHPCTGHRVEGMTAGTRWHSSELTVGVEEW